MENNMKEMLKKDLAKAIKEKNYVRIEELKHLLNISDEQAKYFDKGLTGYPTIDKVWLNYYKDGAEERANNIPLNKTVWDVIESKLLEHYEYPALEYFKREFSRQEFIDLCYTWARTFRAMGVEPGEVVPVYGIFVPDVCAMVFALNMIGACPYFLKLNISPEALEEETRDAKIAVVFDGMWKNVANEFMKDKFKKVIVASVPADMPAPLNKIVKIKDVIDARKNKSQIPNEKKYIWADKARQIGNYYTGEVKVPFVPNRSSFITSSSGTTIGGIVKGTVATNESTISQLYMGDNSDIQYAPGWRSLTNFPPTASTSLNALFMLALYNGETLIIDPRVSEKDFYNQLINLKPNLAATTGSLWEAFFNRIEKEMKQGKKFDFSYAKAWAMGGEGSDVKKVKKWYEIMEKCNADTLLLSGYGSSEVFSIATMEHPKYRYDFSGKIMSVGIPYVGITVGIFDENDNELSYGQRGQIKIKSKSAMKEYYKKPELTAQTKVDGWINTGDLGEIDENGFIYIYGRVKDSIMVNGSKYYMFDIANEIKKMSYIDDAIVLSKPTEDNDYNLVAHIVWDEKILDEDKTPYIEDLNKKINGNLRDGLYISAYAVHEKTLPYSPTTMKKDKNRMTKQLDGYIQVIDGKMNNVEFILNNNGKHTQICAIMDKGRGKTLTRK